VFETDDAGNKHGAVGIEPKHLTRVRNRPLSKSNNRTVKNE
jgi:hypothetical protein